MTGASQATELVGLAEARFWFATSQSGDPVAMEMDGPTLARSLRGGRDSLRAELAAQYLGHYGKVPSAAALADTMCVLEGRATANHVETHLRVAKHGDARVLDLGDPSGRVVVIEPGSWRIESRSPVHFRRTELTSALPEPVRGGDLDDLRRLLNVAPESWQMLKAHLVASLLPEIPHPVPAFMGEQGTGKSTAARFLVNLMDASPAPLRSAPRDPHEWGVVASGSWAVALDNISTIPPWLQDSICRACTGDGLVKRRLYADSSLTVLSFRRVVVLTSIDAGALRGDLADRLLIIELERINPRERLADADLHARWETLHPRLLGALLDLTAETLAELPKVKLKELPRMADFGRVLAAVDRVTGSEGLAAYLGQSVRVAEEVVDSDLVAGAILHLVAAGPWEGTATELLVQLTPERSPRHWPTTPKSLAGRIKRAAPALRALGVEVDFRRTGTGRLISLEKNLKPASRASSSPVASPTSPPNDASDAPDAHSKNISGHHVMTEDLGAHSNDGIDDEARIESVAAQLGGIIEEVQP